MNPVILQIEAVTRQFDQTSHPAVNKINLTLYQQEILVLLGASGCGKTTLLRLIAGFERPQTGTIDLNGQRVAGTGRWLPPERRDIGMVFQDYALFPHLTVAENVAFGLHPSRLRSASSVSKDKRQTLVCAAIDQVGLAGLETRYPHQLSGGQQQRVALARALAPRPSLILLDEPLSNLDTQVRLKLRQEVSSILRMSGTSAIFVTHDQEEALSIADRVAVMNRGQIEQIATPETLYREPVSAFVAQFISQANLLPATFDGKFWQTAAGSFEASQQLPLDSTSAQAWMMIRQEDLQLIPDEKGSVIISDRQFLGRDYFYRLITTCGYQLYARLPANHAIPVNTAVRLQADRHTVRLFPNSQN